MKIMHINCVYPSGSTGRITEELHNALKNEGHKSIVLYSRGKRAIGEDAIRVCSTFFSKLNHFVARVSGLAHGGCLIETRRIIKKIKKYNPDIVHLQCINGYFVNIYKLVEFLNKNSINTLLTLHAEFMYTANCACTFDCDKWTKGCGDCPILYKATESYFVDRTAESFNKMKKAFGGFGDKIRIVGVSEWLSNQAKKSQIMENLNIVTIHNGIDTKTFYPRNYKETRAKLGFKEYESIVLWVTSVYSEDKGKGEFQKLVSLFNEFENIRFIVAGARDVTINNDNIDFLGRINSKDNLAELYSAADVMICCSKQESFPTVSLESQCCGTPVVGFDVGGVRETIFPQMGEVVEQGDIVSMKNAIDKWSRVKKDRVNENNEEIINAYASRRMVNEYFSIYKALLEEKNEQ